ncbi:MAG: SufE family protein [Bdellovibrionales bacterium]
MNLIETKKQKLISEFSAISDWEDRYKRIIELGKQLPVLPESSKTENNKVKGCQSQVWIVTTLSGDGSLQFQADSDALIVKGLVAIIVDLYSGSKPEEILKFQPDFMKSLGFDTHLSPSRTNGLYAMIKRIVLEAYQYSTNKR